MALSCICKVCPTLCARTFKSKHPPHGDVRHTGFVVGLALGHETRSFVFEVRATGDDGTVEGLPLGQANAGTGAVIIAPKKLTEEEWIAKHSRPAAADGADA